MFRSGSEILGAESSPALRWLQKAVLLGLNSQQLMSFSLTPMTWGIRILTGWRVIGGSSSISPDLGTTWRIILHHARLRDKQGSSWIRLCCGTTQGSSCIFLGRRRGNFKGLWLLLLLLFFFQLHVSDWLCLWHYTKFHQHYTQSGAQLASHRPNSPIVSS